MSEKQTRGQTPLERILLHVVQTVTVAGIIGGYVGISELRTSNAVLQIELRGLTERLDDFRALARDSYTTGQAERDLRPILDRADDHEKRLRALEHKSTQ